MNNDIPHLNDVLLELSPLFRFSGTQPFRSLDEEAADEVVEQVIKGGK